MYYVGPELNNFVQINESIMIITFTFYVFLKEHAFLFWQYGYAFHHNILKQFYINIFLEVA
jgi:hypothetical protein